MPTGIYCILLQIASISGRYRDYVDLLIDLLLPHHSKLTLFKYPTPRQSVTVEQDFIKPTGWRVFR